MGFVWISCMKASIDDLKKKIFYSNILIPKSFNNRKSFKKTES